MNMKVRALNMNKKSRAKIQKNSPYIENRKSQITFDRQCVETALLCTCQVMSAREDFISCCYQPHTQKKRATFWLNRI